LFGLVYFAQGIGQDSGLVAQPLQYFFKEALGFNPAQTTEYLAVLTIPWTLKPLYGLVSDFIPLLGYRRKTWLLLANALAVSGFLWLSGVSDPGAVVVALMLTAFGTAASDVIIDAIMVENGKRTGLTARFQSVQWMWISIASILSSLLGGWLCTVFGAGTAFRIAALVTLLAPLAVMVAGWLILHEEKGAIDLIEMKATTANLLASFRSRTLWAVIAFLAFWNFSPSLGTPWYYHQVDNLNFSQAFIGMLGGFEAFGGVLGALAYWLYLSKGPLRKQLGFGIWAGTTGTLLFLLLLRPSSYSHAIAINVNLLVGAATMVAVLATLTLAAQACPAKSEGFTFAALMSVNNGVAQVSAIIGARLYTDVLQSMLPLILVSAAFTFACLLLLPMLQKAQIIGGAEGGRTTAP
jgi:MFS family permease